MANPFHRQRIALSVAAVILVSGLLAGTALATSGGKFYIPTISPTSGAAGQSLTYTFTVQNSPNSGQSFGSANLTIPSGWGAVTLGTIKTLLAGGGTGTKVWQMSQTVSSTCLAGTICLRSPGPSNVSSLSPGQAVQFTFSSTNPSVNVCATTGYTFKTRVKQSNDFLGTNNDFSLASGASDPVVTVAGACAAPTVTTQPTSQSVIDGDPATFLAAASGIPTPTVQWQVSTDAGVTWTPIAGATSTTLSFTAHVSDQGQYRTVFTSIAGTASSNTAALSVAPYGAAAIMSLKTQPSDTLVNTTMTPAVEVLVTDNTASHHPVPGVAVSLAIGANPCGTNAGCNLSGGSATTDANGIATFALSFDTSGSNYSLVASATGLSDVTSNLFDVTSAVDTVCTNGICTATATSGGSKVTVVSNAGTTPLKIIFEPTALNCGSPVFNGQTVTIDPPVGATGSVQVSLDDLVTGTPTGPYPICKTVEVGTTITTELAPFCSDIAPQGLDLGGTKPCIVKQTTSAVSSTQFHLISDLLITPTDPSLIGHR